MFSGWLFFKSFSCCALKGNDFLYHLTILRCWMQHHKGKWLKLLRLTSVRWGCTKFLASLPFFFPHICCYHYPRWMKSYCDWEQLLGFSVAWCDGATCYICWERWSPSLAHQECSWAEPETGCVFEYMHGETCALCLSVLWCLRDRHIRHGFAWWDMGDVVGCCPLPTRSSLI